MMSGEDIEVVVLVWCWMLCLYVSEGVVRYGKNDWNGWWVGGGFK